MIYGKERHKGPEKPTGDKSLLTVNGKLKIPPTGNSWSSVKSFLNRSPPASATVQASHFAVTKLRLSLRVAGVRTLARPQRRPAHWATTRESLSSGLPKPSPTRPRVSPPARGPRWLTGTCPLLCSSPAVLLPGWLLAHLWPRERGRCEKGAWAPVGLSQVALEESFIPSQFQLPHRKHGLTIASSNVFVKMKAYIVIESTFILLLPDSQTTLPRSAALLPRAPAGTHAALRESSFSRVRDSETEDHIPPVSAFPAVLGGCSGADFVGTWLVCHLTLMCHSAAGVAPLLVLSDC